MWEVQAFRPMVRMPFVITLLLHVLGVRLPQSAGLQQQQYCTPASAHVAWCTCVHKAAIAAHVRVLTSLYIICVVWLL